MSATDARLRRLPLVDRPFRRETIRSFLAQLAALNHLEHARLAELVDARLDRHELRFPSDNILTRLSALTGFPAARLALAFPLRHQPDLTAHDQPGPEDFTHRPWLACRFCSAGRRPHGAPVKQWPLLTLQGCLRHRRWIGPGRRANDRQLDLAQAPAILTAARRHQALHRRVGPIQATTTISEAAKIVEENLHIGPVPHELRTRLSALIRINVDSPMTLRRNEDSFIAAIYPDVVDEAHRLLARTPPGPGSSRRPAGFAGPRHQAERRRPPDSGTRPTEKLHRVAHLGLQLSKLGSKVTNYEHQHEPSRGHRRTARAPAGSRSGSGLAARPGEGRAPSRRPAPQPVRR